MRGIFDNVCSDAHDMPVEMDGEDDDMHLLAEYPPKVAVLSLVNSLKDALQTPPPAPRPRPVASPDTPSGWRP